MKKKQSELFEEEIEEEIEVAEEVVVPEVADIEDVVKPKKVRKKRVLTEIQKEKLRENLKKGREKSLETRRRNKELKNMKKDKTKEAEDDELLKHLTEKKEKKTIVKNTIVSENEALKKRLDEMEERFSSMNSKKLSSIKEDETETPSDRKNIENLKKSQSQTIEKSPKKTDLPSIYEPPKPVKIHSSLLAGGLSLDDLRLM